jgi:Rab-like protein 5
MDDSLKIIVIGPSSSGKSCLTNFLANRIDSISSTYRPTVGVRILRTTKKIKTELAPEGEDVKLQFWDLSGDPKFENCWLAVKQKVDGIILVLNGDIKVAQEDIEGLIRNFPKEMEIKPTYCLGFLHHPSGSFKSDSKSIQICGLHFFHTSVEEGKNTINPLLEKLVNKIMAKKMAEMGTKEGQEEEY